MIDYSGWCEDGNHFLTIVIDTTKLHDIKFLCQECEQKQVIEKRDKKLNQLLKLN